MGQAERAGGSGAGFASAAGRECGCGGTNVPESDCDGSHTRNGPEAMFSCAQDDQARALVRKHLDENLRRVYAVSAELAGDADALADRFSALLERIRKREAGALRR